MDSVDKGGGGGSSIDVYSDRPPTFQLPASPGYAQLCLWALWAKIHTDFSVIAVGTADTAKHCYQRCGGAGQQTQHSQPNSTFLLERASGALPARIPWELP